MKNIKNLAIKTICLCVLVIMLFPFVACGGDDYEYKEGDFSLTVAVDKTEAAVGDTIEITATFKNLSGRDIRIQTPFISLKKLEYMIAAGLFPENQDYGFSFFLEEGSLLKTTIKKDTVLTRMLNHSIDECVNYIAIARIEFCVGKDYSEFVEIGSQTIKILVEDNN